MALIADILLVAASLGLAAYCIVLSRRLSRFTDLEKGVGGAVAVLSAQVDDLTRALRSAQSSAQSSASKLSETTERAEDAARRLELHVAALHDLPSEPDSTDSRHDATGLSQDHGQPAPTSVREFDVTSSKHTPPDPSPEAGGEDDHEDPVAPAEATFSHVANDRKSPATVFSSHRRIQPGALG